MKKYHGTNVEAGLHDVRTRMAEVKLTVNGSLHFNVPFTHKRPGDCRGSWPYVDYGDDDDRGKWSYVGFVVGLAEEAVWAACWQVERPEDFENFYEETHKLLKSLSCQPDDIQPVSDTRWLFSKMCVNVFLRAARPVSSPKFSPLFHFFHWPAMTHLAFSLDCCCYSFFLFSDLFSKYPNSPPAPTHARGTH